MNTKNKKINIIGTDVTISSQSRNDYISLTDMARHKDSKRTDYIIQNWMRNRNSIEFLGIWETLNNPDFKPIEFEGVRNASGLNSFVLTPKQWIEKTNTIKENIIPKHISKKRSGFVYASEADVLNVALFGIIAKEWQDQNPDKTGNIRDYATLEQLVVLSNLESINAMLLHQGLNQKERLMQLNAMAITQMESLLAIGNVQKRLNNNE